MLSLETSHHAYSPVESLIVIQEVIKEQQQAQDSLAVWSYINCVITY